ncbi:hypothetical protein CMI37_08315 [Candidatus Pacearchaeota archaeon]|nr:hypothetical protein [Candidatus Pacearchaeota archaeon]
MSSYKTISGVISDINVMIAESPLPNKVKYQLTNIVKDLEQLPEVVREHLVEKGDSIGLHHDD